MSAGEIILVEDDPGMREALERVLSAAGFTPRSFPSGEALLDAQGGVTAGCLVLDVRLPGISGLDLYRRLAQRGQTLPAVFITAYDDPSVREEAEGLGAAAFLHKPFRGRALVEVVSEIIGVGAAS